MHFLQGLTGRLRQDILMHFNHHKPLLPPVLALVAVCTLAVGCTTVETQSFRVADSPNVASVFIATDADFGKYDRLNAEDMGIYFPQEAAPSVDDQQRTRTIFREAFLGELTDYQIVQENGPSTLMVQATLIDFRNASPADTISVRRELRDIAKPGSLLFLMELKDSVSGRTLARAADSASAPSFSSSADISTDWTSVESAADRWAKLFRQFLDENLNK
jgi:hypothetical protein